MQIRRSSVGDQEDFELIRTKKRIECLRLLPDFLTSLVVFEVNQNFCSIETNEEAAESSNFF